MVVLAADKTSIREYYGMPEGEIPFNAYEDRKVKELSERITSREGSVKSSNVHIVSGSKGEQVRRIAYLTVLKLIKSGAEVIPVSGTESLSEVPERTSRYQVFLIDENEVIKNLPEGESFGPDRVTGIMRHIRTKFTRNHAIFLSLSQETYDSGFKENIDSGSSIDTSPVEESIEKKLPAIKNSNANSYWYAFLLPAISFLVSILYHYFQVNRFPFPYGSLEFTIFFDVINPAIVFGPIILTAVGIVVLFFLGKDTERRSRRILYAGLILLIGEIIVPIIWALTLGIPASELVYSSSIIGDYTAPLLLFLSFQSVAAISFLLIPLSLANKVQRAMLATAFIISVMFLAGVYLNISMNIHPLNGLVSTPPLLSYPMEVPYNTFFFGLVYGPSFYVTSILSYLAYISQGLFGASYLYISLSRRRIRSKLKTENNSPEPQTA